MAKAMATGTKLRVDPIACDGRGLCAEVVPELIWLDDWGFPIIADGIVPARLCPAAAEAVRMCPKLALRLEPAPQPPRLPWVGPPSPAGPGRPGEDTAGWGWVSGRCRG